jgi:hypothetical protein
MADDFFTANDAAAALNDIKESGSDVDPSLETIDSSEGYELPEGIQFYQTSTTAFKTGRTPRTVRAAYDHESNTMYVIFWSGTYWGYDDVPVEVWNGFKGEESKGAFLWNNGFDSRGPSGMIYQNGEVDMDKISQRRKSALAANFEVAKKLQAAYQGRKTSKKLYGKGHDYRLRGQGGFDR